MAGVDEKLKLPSRLPPKQHRLQSQNDHEILPRTRCDNDDVVAQDKQVAVLRMMSGSPLSPFVRSLPLDSCFSFTRKESECQPRMNDAARSRSVADAMDKSSYVEFITSLHSRVQNTCESDPVMLSSPRCLGHLNNYHLVPCTLGILLTWFWLLTLFFSCS